MIGSQKRRINIFADYLLTLNGKNGFVLDAKAPSEAIVKSPLVEQVFSYAIHPDIRVPIYALCNGHELVVYDTQEFDPIFSCRLAEIDDNWDAVARILAPDSIANPKLRKFKPDFGVRALKAGLGGEIDWYFIGTEIDNFQKVSDHLVTVLAGFNDNGTDCALSLDLPAELFLEIVATCSDAVRSQIELGLSQSPFLAMLDEPLVASLEARIGEPIKSTENGEVFAPFIVRRFAG